MIITETKLKGSYVIDLERFGDERGFFATNWSLKKLTDPEFGRMVESNLSTSVRKGTMRGMHFQRAPHAQAKIVRCTRGSVYDVIIDLRPASPTFKQWVGVELSAENRRTLCVPREFAHGIQTLEDDTEIFYLVSDFYAPETSGGVRWDDPAFGIVWPHVEERIIIPRDRDYPDFKL
ncbi:MAG: dTDP-4-dehydrorhamnose 3,5-epimerase [Acidobacteria bacterium]|nr:dTDP-4-dehydrorhamnose 3,5-epimerase [Acidobacteriota bacterium]